VVLIYFFDKMAATVSYKDWEEKTRDFHLTIADVLEMKQGESQTFICMDRNVWDIALCGERNPPSSTDADQGVDPMHFFRNNLLTVTADCAENPMKGTWQWHWGGNYTVEDQTSRDREFEINYQKESWYPLTDGKLPENDPQGFACFPWNKPGGLKRIHWSEYPLSTRLGWRGVMVKQSPFLPKVLFTADDAMDDCCEDNSNDE
jgi:hypothetical protein